MMYDRMNRQISGFTAFLSIFKNLRERKQPIKSILRRKKVVVNHSGPTERIRFRDLCKSSYPALAFLSEDARLFFVVCRYWSCLRVAQVQIHLAIIDFLGSGLRVLGIPLSTCV